MEYKGIKIQKLKHNGKIYEGLGKKDSDYYISTKGQVFALTPMSPYVKKRRPSINIDGKNFPVAQAVIETFGQTKVEWILSTEGKPADVSKEAWKNPPDEVKMSFARNGVHVDHKDGDSMNDDISNLQYMHAMDNIKKGGKKS